MNDTYLLIVMPLYLAIVVVLIYGPWQRLMVDMARQRLFELRDEIFDLAADGQVSFDDAGYREVRSTFNTMIRFCHVATWPVVVTGSRLADDREPSLHDLTASLPDPVREKVVDNIKAASNTLVLLLWSRSPLLLAITALVAPLLAVATLVALLLNGKPLLTRMAAALSQRIDPVRKRIRDEAILGAG
jgi:cbb3-type cytochrome oxidase subunit 3